MSKVFEQQVRALEDRVAAIERWMKAQEDKRLNAVVAHAESIHPNTLKLKRG